MSATKTAWLTVAEVSDRLRCNPWTVGREIKRNNLRATKVAGKWLIDPADLDRYVKAGFNVGRSA
jgi:excisionase family DNA binding protein